MMDRIADATIKRGDFEAGMEWGDGRDYTPARR